MSFVYEVNLEIDASRAEEFHRWLVPHIQEMLTFPGFVRASWYERNPKEENNDGDVVLWTILYQLENDSFYERYVLEQAPRMRQEGLELFGGSFRASRRLLRQYEPFYSTK